MGFICFLNKCLERYLKNDWGDLDEYDKCLNERAINEGELRVFAAYIYPETGEKIWIITEADRRATTILFPYEY